VNFVVDDDDDDDSAFVAVAVAFAIAAVVESLTIQQQQLLHLLPQPPFVLIHSLPTVDCRDSPCNCKR
jgi:hypothetical protein